MKNLFLFVSAIALVFSSCSRDSIENSSRSTSTFNLYFKQDGLDSYKHVSDVSLLKIWQELYSIDDLSSLSELELQSNLDSNNVETFSVISRFEIESTEVESGYIVVTIGTLVEKITGVIGIDGDDNYSLKAGGAAKSCTCAAYRDCSTHGSYCQLEFDAWGCYCSPCPYAMEEGYCKKTETSKGTGFTWEQVYIDALERGILDIYDFLN